MSIPGLIVERGQGRILPKFGFFSGAFVSQRDWRGTKSISNRSARMQESSIACRDSWLSTRILFTSATGPADTGGRDEMSSVSASLSMPRGGRCGNA
jgi:hypothetical protein